MAQPFAMQTSPASSDAPAYSPGRGDWSYAPEPPRKYPRHNARRVRRKAAAVPRPPAKAVPSAAKLPAAAKDCSDNGHCPPMANNLFNQQYERPAHGDNWWAFLLALAALTAGIYLKHYSELGYVLGLRRKDSV